MSFFLPRRLIDFEYFGDNASDEEYMKIAEPYEKDIDFAFFVANFGYSKHDYEQLTRRERAFIYKSWETREISHIFNIYNAVYAAIYNVRRGKSKRAIKPVKKKTQQKANMSSVKDNLKIIKDIEEKEGKEWVRRIFMANGLKPPERR